MTKKALLLLGMAFIASACFGVGDAGFRVKGVLENQQGLQLENCLLELYIENKDLLVDKKNVSGSFMRMFIVAPERERYFIVVSCGESLKTYTTPVFEIHSTEKYRNPIDLGVLQLMRK